MLKPIKYRSVEKSKDLRGRSFSIESARRQAKRKQIYRLPNGLYVWRK